MIFQFLCKTQYTNNLDNLENVLFPSIINYLSNKLYIRV